MGEKKIPGRRLALELSQLVQRALSFQGSKEYKQHRHGFSFQIVSAHSDKEGSSSHYGLSS
eukprot:1147666-Pelagomonas_calceolata.AAC.15